MALMTQPYPQPMAHAEDAEAERDFTLLQEIIRAVRNARNEAGVDAARWISALIAAGERTPILEANRQILSRLARIEDGQLTIAATIAERPSQATTLVIAPVEVILPLAGMVDLAAERERLEKELERVTADIERRRGKLENEQFISKAPANVVQKERDALTAQETAAATIRERLAAF